MDNRDRVTDDKDASRTIRMGFTDGIVVSHNTREFTETRFLMDESLYKGHQAWVSWMTLSAIRGDPTAIFWELHSSTVNV